MLLHDRCQIYISSCLWNNRKDWDQLGVNKGIPSISIMIKLFVGYSVCCIGTHAFLLALNI